MSDWLRQHLGEIWAASAVAVILSSIAAGALLVSDQVVGCTGPVKLVSLQPVEANGKIELPAGMEIREAARSRPVDPEIWVVASVPRADVEALFDQEVFEKVVEAGGELPEDALMMAFWEDRPDWISPVPDETNRYLFAEHTFREWEHMAEFVSILAVLDDGEAADTEVFIAVKRVYSD